MGIYGGNGRRDGDGRGRMVFEMIVGVYDGDSHNYPNLPLMKISAWHKARGDLVEWANPMMQYDVVYVSRIFGDEYSSYKDLPFNAEKVVYGGTGFAITVENGKEVYRKEKDANLPDEIEHMMPDYSLYEYCRDTAIGFLTRGCPNNCPFCIVSKKEGRRSHKVADLSEWYAGQKNIDLLDANILACPDRMDLIRQLEETGARVRWVQGLDARFMTEETAEAICMVKTSIVHFAFDRMKDLERIVRGLQVFRKKSKLRPRECIVYILTNYDTTIEEDLERVEIVRALGFSPDVRIYRKPTAPQILKDLQRWSNNRALYEATEFAEYETRGRSMKEQYEEVRRWGTR